MKVLVLLGSNVEPDRHVQDARAILGERFEVLAASAVYESEAVGAPETPRFQNQALLIEGPFCYDDLRRALRGIENDLGRERCENRFAPRTMDIDILMAVDEQETRESSVPVSEELKRYHHALVPAAELCATWQLEDGRTLSQACQELGERPEGFVRVE